ncbi:hypothetical protein GCM10009120_07860 [Sphingobacterium siyangense subsp. cladoniae]|uniref:FecR family protein n=1 Tax=Sphingobacterium siyangense TaxID=459529 RepID=UPI0031F768CE
MNEQELNELFRKYREGTLGSDEKARLESWYIDYGSKSHHELSSRDATQLLESLRGKLPLTRTAPVKPLWRRLTVAAACILLLSTGGYFFLYRSSSQQQNITILKDGDIAPGGNKAVLTLADGTKLVLDDAHEGELAKQSGAIISKTDSGHLEYSAGNGIATPERSGTALKNTLSTPTGGQYRLTLPDGTRVWLNAASSITYPVAFNNKERTVSISGEAYLEVAKNSAKPFRAYLPDGSEIRVLGTHFNVNSYADEQATTTTLLEGAVQVSKAGTEKLLLPGQQAVYSGGKWVVKPVDTALFIAWKDGDFRFHATPLKQVLRQLERWYGISVDYENVPDRQLHGAISREKNLSAILYMIERTSGLKFRLKERRLQLED